MDNQPGFDRSLFIPIFLSGCSVVGIVVVLLIGRSLSSPPEAPVTPSPTRFQYLYLGTEPAIATPIVEETEVIPTDEPLEAPTEAPPGFPTSTLPGIGTPVILTQPGSNRTPTSILLRTNTPSTPSSPLAPTLPPTATSASGPPLNPGIYDNVDYRLVYGASWQNQTVPGAYGNTLQVSLTPGTSSTISFRFIGTQLRLLYQGAGTLGQLRIVIDNQAPYTLNESSGSEWASTILSNNTHTVVITHTGGGSVNVDQIIIPDPSTPTPTRTPTTQGG